MSRLEATALLVAGLLAFVAGLVWLVGAWALIAAGLLLTLTALLIPVRERREPTDPDLPP